MRGNAWPAERAALVREHYATMSGPELAELAGVPIRALHRYASAHKLRKSRETISRVAASKMHPDHPLLRYRFKTGENVPGNLAATAPRKSIAAMLSDIESMGKPKTKWRFP